MALQICSMASSSKGNCVFVGSEKTRILIDAGVSLTRVKKSLTVLGEHTDIANKPLNVLITHNHGDHIRNIDILKRHTNCNVYAHPSSAIHKKKNILYTEFGLEPFTIGDILVTPFSVPHDTPCVGFTLECGGARVSLLTDLGECSEDIMGNIVDSDIVFLEANHDVQMLREGDYPIELKRRVLSSEGHLSNDASATIAERLVRGGRTKQIILGHLSQQNNTVDKAEKTVLSRIVGGTGAQRGKDFLLDIAPAEGMSGFYVAKAMRN